MIQSDDPFKDYFSSYETGQSVGGAKTAQPREKPPGTPASRTWLVSHVPRVGLGRGEMVEWLMLNLSGMGVALVITAEPGLSTSILFSMYWRLIGGFVEGVIGRVIHVHWRVKTIHEVQFHQAARALR